MNEWNNKRDVIVQGKVSCTEDFPGQYVYKRYVVGNTIGNNCVQLKQWVQNQTSDKFWFQYDNGKDDKCSAWMISKKFEILAGLGPSAL